MQLTQVQHFATHVQAQEFLTCTVKQLLLLHDHVTTNHHEIISRLVGVVLGAGLIYRVAQDIARPWCKPKAHKINTIHKTTPPSPWPHTTTSLR